MLEAMVVFVSLAYWSQWGDLVLKLIQAIVSLGDVTSQMLVLIFQALGLTIPLWVARAVAIISSIVFVFAFWSRLGYSIKIGLALVVMAVIIAMFSGSVFGPGVLFGS